MCCCRLRRRRVAEPLGSRPSGDERHEQRAPAEQRRRRDETPWTVVQGILAPLQFLIFLISVVLVINYLNNGSGFGAATASVIAKTLVLYAIMVTGAIWEKVVFGRYLFAGPFFWEDVVSMGLNKHFFFLLAFPGSREVFMES